MNWLNKAEQECSHMSQCPDEASLREWREEFREIPRDEHCLDCPIFKEEAKR